MLDYENHGSLGVKSASCMHDWLGCYQQQVILECGMGRKSIISADEHPAFI
uniref:Uncharacterized protein n=1 Tax=Arundo donax TaxID=35708 RepID=A0A0A8Z7A2_ARUDO